jgi:hypothetical protein
MHVQAVKSMFLITQPPGWKNQMLLLLSKTAKTQTSSEINRSNSGDGRCWIYILLLHIPGISSTKVLFHLLSSYWEINQLKI